MQLMEGLSCHPEGSALQETTRKRTMMIANMEWLSPTRATGMAAYGFAAACCGVAWATAKGDRVVSRLAALLTFTEGFLFFDIVFNWRWMVHQALMDAAMRRNLYGSRRGPQELVLGV